MLRIQNEIHLAAAFEGKPVWDYYEENFHSRSGKSYVNFSGFLALLELELGLGGASFSGNAQGRLVRYWKACKGKMTGSFITSFETDGLAVASRLLIWRDYLIMAGWNAGTPLPETAPEILKIISSVENAFSAETGLFEGEEDRWTRVWNQVSKIGFEVPKTLLCKKLICHDLKDAIAPMHLKVLEKLKSGKMQIEFRVPEIHTEENNSALGVIQKILKQTLEGHKPEFIQPEADSSLQVIELKERLPLYEYLSRLILSSDKQCQFIGSAFGFNGSGLQKFGIPSPNGVNAKEVTGLQLPGLLASPLFLPQDVKRLHAFLSCRPCPVPSGLRSQLRNHLGRNFGFGPRWEEIVENWFRDENQNGNLLWHGLTEEEIRFLIPKNPKPGKKDEAKVDDLLKAFRIVKKWTYVAGRFPEDNALFQEIDAVCGNVIRFLENWDDESIDHVKFNRAMKKLAGQKAISSGEKEAASPSILKSPGGLIGQVNEIIWINFFDIGTGAISPYTELGTAVHDFLRNHLNDNYFPELPSTQQKREWQHYCRGIMQARKKCTLIIPDSQASASGRHPLMSVLGKRLDNLIKQPETIEEEMQVFGLENHSWSDVAAFPEISKTPYFEMGEDLKDWVRKNLLRENLQTQNWELKTVESPTSLETLIQKPMKWFLSKLDHFRDSNAIKFQSDSLQKGNAFHRLVESVLEIENSERTESKIKELLNEAIMEKAAFLFLPENRIHLNEFSDDAQESLTVLLEFIRLNVFEVVGIEESFVIQDNQKIPVESLKGKADLLLKNKRGEKIVIDLKWSSKADKFRKLVSEKDSIQLSVYSLMDAGITSMAYLVFPEKALIGGLQTWLIPPSLNRLGSDLEFTTGNAENTLLKLKNSILFRATELAKGKVETGSGFGPEDLLYMQDQEGIRISHNEEKTQYQTELLTITQTFR